ncbi:hypothetical protein QYE76_005287 [Lolium multiflorum]|uniref:Transposase (putative) gypsy type domain-containing protein n=1 Tax=Lolium multiflorum TaxID=4521 RepID=A0AAD8RUK4_LOLMU|nr:hypothetical protein QYE76_005287 [Lolium multiflorum]
MGKKRATASSGATTSTTKAKAKESSASRKAGTGTNLDWAASTILKRDEKKLTPNSILHIAIFITVREAFLGIDPHWDLWRKIFYVKRHSGGEGPHVIGGVGFVVRKEVNYFNFPMRDSVQGF